MNHQEFKKLNRKDKNEFLSNEMAERIIRVEQKVSAKFGRLLHYNSTEYYKSLSSAQRQSYEKYLKNKNKRKVVISLFFLIPIFLIFLLNYSLTGNVINENLDNYGISNYVLEGFILLFFVMFIIYLVYKRIRNRKIDGYFNIINTFLDKKISK